MSAAPEATGRQPIIVWKCDTCGRVDRTRWLAGRHRDERDGGLNHWCHGKADGPFYLISQDQYLDVLLAPERSL